MQGHRQRAAGRGGKGARVTGGQDDDAVNAEISCDRDRGVVDEPAVDEGVPVDGHRRQDPGQARAGEHRLGGGCVPQNDLPPGGDLGGDDDDRHGGVQKPVIGDVAGQQLAQPAVGDDVVAAPRGRAQDADRGGGEHVRSSQRAPDLRQVVEPGWPGLAGDERGVERSDGRADDDVGDDPGFGQRRSIPTWTAPRLPPPDSTRAVLTRAFPGRCCLR